MTDYRDEDDDVFSVKYYTRYGEVAGLLGGRRLEKIERLTVMCPHIPSGVHVSLAGVSRTCSCLTTPYSVATDPEFQRS